MSEPKAGKTSIEDVIDAATLRETEVQLCLSGDLAAEADRLQAQLDALPPEKPRSSLAEVNPRAAIESELDEVHALMRENLTTFRFRALGRTAWLDLVAQHPGRNDGEAWNPETFTVALVAACAIEPEMTLDQAERLFEKINADQRGDLWSGAYGANTRETRVPFSHADSRNLPSSGKS